MSRALPILVAIVLAVYSVIDCAMTDPAEVPGPRKPAWFALILLIPILGPLSWVIARRARRRPPPPRRQAPPPVAPDDNPEFLREIRRVDERHEQMLEEWEAELRRREDELRQRPDADDEPH